MALMESLIRNLIECGADLGDGEQKTLQEVLESCRGDLQRFRVDQLASTGEVLRGSGIPEGG